ncbi:MAG: Jag N-terminal domain-containing protein [Clostridiales bacterium]|nr:Jag N-terminal domain-containing protein [Clostridiales bacterium]
MNFVETTGKTVDEAIAQALIQLGVPSDQVNIEVLEEGSKGILGLFGKMTRIRATLKEDTEEEEIYNDLAAIRETISEIKEQKEPEEEAKPQPEVKPEPQPAHEPEIKEEVKAPEVDVEKKAALFLMDVLEAMGIDAIINTSLTEDNVLEIDVEDSAEESSMGVIIGKRGNTLDSLQYLTTMVVNKDTTEHIRVKLDTENYRARRQDTLEKLARSLARKVRKTGHKVVLEPMNPYERRIIHYTLQNDPAVETHSEGEEPYRKVVITPKRGRR